MRVHLKAASFKPNGHFKSWLYSIASHLAVDHARKKKPAVENPELLDEIPDSGPDAIESFSREERKKQVQAALQQLPDRQRAALMLSYFEGLPYAQVATAMGCSVGSVKTHVSRALHTLARVLPNPTGGLS